MTSKEINRLYWQILGETYRHETHQAMHHLTYLLQQIGFGPLYDELRQLETTYRYLVQYALEGYADEHRNDTIAAINRSVAGLADRARWEWMKANSTLWYYGQVRQAGRKTLFDRLLFSDIWTPKEAAEWEMRLPDLDLASAAQAPAALLLSLIKQFDAHKILFLCSLCLHTDEMVSQRALTALLLAVSLHENRLAHCPEVSSRLSLLQEEPAVLSSWPVIMAQLARAKDVEKVSARMRDEFLPEMNRLSSSIQDKIQKMKDKPEDAADWSELFDDGGMSEKMQEFQQMQMEGEDVYLSTFRQLKFYPFFTPAANWFLPFDRHHPDLSGLDSLNDRTMGIDLMKLTARLDYLCDSDKYSFCLNLLQVPAEYRRQMAQGLGADSEAFQEMMKAESDGSHRLERAQLSNHFIQDLYRFFLLFPQASSFANPFAGDMNFTRNPLLKPSLSRKEDLDRLAMVWFKHRHYAQAADIYRLMLKTDPNDFNTLRRLGYCQQQTGCHLDALETYRKAELIETDNLWTLRRLAACCRQLGRNREALDYYERATALDGNSLSLCLGHAQCLMDLGQYQQALNVCFKADYLSPDQPRVWRVLARALTLSGRFEQAEKYSDRILSSDSAVLEDYLDAGLVRWLQGRPKETVDLYEKGIRQLQVPLEEFMERLTQELPRFRQSGITDDSVEMVRDGLYYRMLP